MPLEYPGTVIQVPTKGESVCGYEGTDEEYQQLKQLIHSIANQAYDAELRSTGGMTHFEHLEAAVYKAVKVALDSKEFPQWFKAKFYAEAATTKSEGT